MKRICKRLLILAAIFVAGQSAAQVGVGTPMPNSSAQLDVVATNKGVLMPRVALTGTTDATTISSGNVTSLFVCNTAKAGTSPNNVVPGYYYWDGAKWARIMNMDDVVTWINSYETVTNLVDNGNGTISYTNEAGTVQTINISAMVTASEMEGVIGNEVNNATANGGLTRSGSGTAASPYTLGMTPGTAAGQSMVWNGTAWVPGAAPEVDGVIGNEVNNATANGGLTRSGAAGFGVTGCAATSTTAPIVSGSALIYEYIGTAWHRINL